MGCKWKAFIRKLVSKIGLLRAILQVSSRLIELNAKVSDLETKLSKEQFDHLLPKPFYRILLKKMIRSNIVGRDQNGKQTEIFLILADMAIIFPVIQMAGNRIKYIPQMLHIYYIYFEQTYFTDSASMFSRTQKFCSLQLTIKSKTNSSDYSRQVTHVQKQINKQGKKFKAKTDYIQMLLKLNYITNKTLMNIKFVYPFALYLNQPCQKIRSNYCQMQDCPIQNCGRKFQNQQALLQHGRRRHPNQYNQIQQAINKSVLENQKNKHQQLHKLPKLNQILNRNESGSEKPKVDIYRRSASKNNASSRQKSSISTILNDSRKIIDGVVTIKRSSIRKNSSQKQLNESSITQSKLPDLNQHKLKNKLFKGVKPLAVNFQKQEQMRRTATGFLNSDQKEQQNFYTTTQGFGKRLDLTHKKSAGQQHRIKIKSNSKDRISSAKKLRTQQGQTLVESVVVQAKKKQQIDNRKISIIQQKNSESSGKNSARPLKKGLQRRNLNASQVLKSQTKVQPQLKVQAKAEQQKQQKKYSAASFNDIIFEDRTVIIKAPLKSLIVPSFSKTEYLFLNSCSLNQVDLNGLQSLITISLCHNNLSSMDFLRYGDNENIENVYLDYNKIETVVIPPNLKVLGISFNQILDIERTANQLKRAQNSLEQIDLSFNPIRKQYNYKVHILASARNLKKIDGIKVTKIDKEMAKQFKQLMDERKGIVPLNNNIFELKMSSPNDKDRPSTAFTTFFEDDDLQSQEVSAQFIKRDIKSLQKTISQTQDQLNTIKGQNKVLFEQMKKLQLEIIQINGPEDPSKIDPLQLYEKLRRQCQVLQVLNFMQYADQQQIQEMILRKRKQKEKQGVIII